jgi:hypothetical protein
MNIIEYYYNENNRRLYIEFSTIGDKDLFYRVLELDYEDIEYYSPSMFYESELHNIEQDFVIELIEQYLLNNDLPEELSL